uniref:Uncharacterized protein n=1 Tax=Cacopsylla melanoneura TaxID=428564 RepID=A0A8D8RJE9_9HEMI
MFIDYIRLSLLRFPLSLSPLHSPRLQITVYCPLPLYLSISISFPTSISSPMSTMSEQSLDTETIMTRRRHYFPAQLPLPLETMFASIYWHLKLETIFSFNVDT